MTNDSRMQTIPLALKYANVGNRQVSGWLEPFSAMYIYELAVLQHESSISGSAVEIGIHHGRLFILLHLAGSSRKDLAIDLFDDQHLNVDRSGRGDQAKFVENLRRWGGDPSRVEIWPRSSLEIKPEEILSTIERPTLFSVDGGHTAECAMNDLLLADAVLNDDGVVILDDFFNEFWPEVCVGAVKYFDDARSRLKPFAITPGKTYLCRADRNEFYRENMKKRFPPWKFDKEVEMFGSKAQILGIGDMHRPNSDKIRQYVASTPIGRSIRSAIKGV